VKRILAVAAGGVLAASASAAPAAGIPVIPAPSEAVAPVYPDAFRTDEITLSLSPMDVEEGAEIEYAIRMKPGQTLVYSWTATGDLEPDGFYVDFHGHPPAEPDFQVMAYREWVGREGHGALTSPFEGTHGWFFQNRSMAPATVTLRLAGFYELRSLRETVLEDGMTEIPFGPPRPAAPHAP